MNREKYLDLELDKVFTLTRVLGQMPVPTKVDCRKGHTYIDGKCRCGKDLGYIRR